MKRVLLCVVSVVCITSFAFSDVVAVKNITFSLPGTFYYVNSEFVLNAAGSADVQTYQAPTSYYDYAIENLSISITPCPLKEDQSSVLGQAKGEFWGGGVLTVTGDLMEANNGDPFGPVLASGTILQAEMVAGSTDTWLLQEMYSFNSSIISGLVDMAPDGAGLNT